MDQSQNNDKSSTVLVVDDNEEKLPLLRAILGAAKFSVVTASSVYEAKSQLNSQHNQIDLVLSDISMPIETGFDLLAWMRSPENGHDQIPVLLITAALPEEENRIKGLSLGAVDYIVRPINNQELILRVRNALEHFKRFRSLRESLESSENLAMTGRILAAANHEIRNLVGLINITSEHAISQAERGMDMRPGSIGFQSLSALSQMTKMLTQVSRDLNSHINSEKIHTSPTSIRGLIDEVVAITQQKLRSIFIEQIKYQEDLYVMADATRVKQILVNFLLNAQDAIKEKGPDEFGRIKILVTESAKDRLQIRIKDNGIGLLASEVKTTFIAFQTTKAVRGGKGLGLWLCSRLACAMGGCITLESQGIGQGATAVLELNRCSPPAPSDFNINDYLID